MKTPREILLKRHQSVEPKLDRMWSKTLAPELRSRDLTWRATLRRGHRNVTDVTERVPPFAITLKLWRELVWPCRRIWAGVACAWLLILGLNLASSDSSARVVSKTEPRSREEIRALIEQRRMLALLIGPMAEPAATERKSNPPGPRSDRTTRISAA